MMKNIRQILCLMLCMVILVSVLVPTVSAAVVPTTDDTITPNRDTLIHPITGDQYSSRTFTTITEAMGTYGSNWRYVHTYEFYAGNVYNWYYFFSDGTKNFFYVIYDEDPINSLPEDVFTE